MVVVVIVIALLALSYYGFDLKKTVESPTTQSNFSYAWTSVLYIWTTYLKEPVTKAYTLFVDLILKPSLEDIKRINSGQLPVSEQQYPQFQYAPATQ
jgi:ammonia channel protein AmtB